MISDPIRCARCGGPTAPHGAVDVRCDPCGNVTPAGRTYTLPVALEARLTELGDRIVALEGEILRALDER